MTDRRGSSSDRSSDIPVICHLRWTMIPPLDRPRGGPGQCRASPARPPDSREDALAMSVPTASGPSARPVPDALGRFGEFGGRFVPETLMDALNRLAEEYERTK